MSLAKQILNLHPRTGATYAKFQSWSVKKNLNPDHGTVMVEDLHAKFKTDSKHIELINHCKKFNIEFLSSVFSINDAKMLKKLNCKAVKIPSFESRMPN